MTKVNVNLNDGGEFFYKADHVAFNDGRLLVYKDEDEYDSFDIEFILSFHIGEHVDLGDMPYDDWCKMLFLDGSVGSKSL